VADGKKITIDLEPDLYPPQATDSFLGNHVYVEDEAGKWQGAVTRADYIAESRSIRLTVEAVDVEDQPT
jgi:hypothetical protein